MLGACVIGDNEANNTSTPESIPVVETPADGIGEVPSTGISKESESPPEVSAQVAIADSEDDTKSDKEKPPKAMSDAEGPDESKLKARAEFFQKITQASEDSKQLKIVSN